MKYCDQAKNSHFHDQRQFKGDLYVDFENLFRIQLNCRKPLDAAK